MLRTQALLLLLALSGACSSPPPADDPFVAQPELLASRVTREVGATPLQVLEATERVFEDHMLQELKRGADPERCVLVSQTPDKVKISLIATSVRAHRSRITLSSGFGDEAQIEQLMLEILERIR